MRHAASIALLLTLIAMQSVSRAHEATTPVNTASPGQVVVASAGSQSAGAAEGEMKPPWWAPQNLLSLGPLQVNSWAGVLQPGRWSGSLDSSFDSYRQVTRSPDNSESRLDGRLLTNGFSLRNENFSLVDPRLVTGNVGLRFATQRSHQNVGDFQSTQTGQLIGYNIDTTVLAEKPYNATMLANRTQNLATRAYGGTTRSDNSNRAVIVRWREDSILRDKEILPYFSATLEAREDHTHEHTTVADQSFHRDEKRSLIGLTGHNGFQTGDLDFRFERADLQNLVYPAGDYQSRVGNIGYSMDFGPNLNRRWDGRVTYNSRSGATSVSTLNVDQRLTIDHYENLSTGYYAELTRQVVQDSTVNARSAGMTLQHLLYQNLTTTLALSGTQQSLPNGSIDTKSAEVGFSYGHRIPWGGRLLITTGGSLQVNNNQLQSSLIPVIDALFQVPQQLGAGAGFLLRDTFVVPESIVVVVVKGSARLPTREGVDYLVLAEGDRTRILPQPTSAVILPGDLVEVSYVFRVDPSLKYRTTSRSINVAADWNWIALSLSHDESLQKPLSEGDSTFLTNRRRDTARLDLRGRWGSLQARGDGTLARYNYTQLIYDEVRLSQHVTYAPRDNWLISLNADQSRANYQLPQRHSEGSTVRLDLDWYYSGWWLTASASRRSFRDTLMPSDEMKEYAARLKRRWSKLDIAGVFGLVDRTRGGVQTTNTRFQLTMIRRF